MRSFVSASVFAAAAALLLTPAPAAAQFVPPSAPEAGTWSVSPFVATSMGIGDPAPGNSLGLGVAVSYNWTGHLAFEGEFSHLLDVAGDAPEVDWSITTFSGNVVYHFDVQRVTPYATAGLGFERSSYSLPDATVPVFDPSATEFVFNFGGGVKIPVAERIHVRADLRRFQALDLAPDFWRLYGGLTFVLNRR